ncbi:MAG: SIS domain-containing protein [Candidatus Hydrogenedentes bacterium]|nr:SIS domain-containing protein [Candidatus Hydrogenedentota bacterium]MBI3119160.1 SIS domain-containing protein [Candidatus Hydrogenedentota bacterium]
MHHLAEMYQQSGSTGTYLRGYADRLSELLRGLDYSVVERIMGVIERACNERKAIYFIANGGSAATASHWVNDLVAGGYVEGQPSFKAFCLADNVESVTALGNDVGFDNIFASQLNARVEPGDVVYAMSVSGNSENIIRAMDTAKRHGATTIGICGFDGGRLKNACDIALHIPTTKDEYGPVEDIFNILDHLVTGYLTMKRGKWLHH